MANVVKFDIVEASNLTGTNTGDQEAGTYAYNPDGTLHTTTTAYGVRTMAYNPDGTLASITGTGVYKTKTFTYVGGVLTGISVE
jgi:YD repeat-containing protein